MIPNVVFAILAYALLEKLKVEIYIIFRCEHQYGPH